MWRRKYRICCHSDLLSTGIATPPSILSSHSDLLSTQDGGKKVLQAMSRYQTIRGFVITAMSDVVKTQITNYSFLEQIFSFLKRKISYNIYNFLSLFLSSNVTAVRLHRSSKEQAQV